MRCLRVLRLLILLSIGVTIILNLIDEPYKATESAVELQHNFEEPYKTTKSAVELQHNFEEQNKMHIIKYQSEIAKLKVKPLNTKIIRVMNGWHKHFRKQNLTCNEYHCILQNGGNTTVGADLLYFNDQDVNFYTKLPMRSQHDIWVFGSLEPQNHIDPKLQPQWDSMFNYSVTYIRKSGGNIFTFRNKFVKKQPTTSWDFATQLEIRSLANKSQKQSQVVWFVSHCAQQHRFPVRSARAEYVLELSKHISINVFTRKDSCRKLFGGLIRNKSEDYEPHIWRYSFYLAFENTLCRDYITEKLWKVLRNNGTTIPVVLGGLSLEEYKRITPPNSFIHVKNFTSPKALANHLKFVAQDHKAWNYYHQWRNKYQLKNFRGKESWCYLCKLAHERKRKVWKRFSSDFGPHNCLDVSAPKTHCSYYNMPCHASSQK